MCSQAVLRAMLVAAVCVPASMRAQVQAGTAVRPETTTVGQHFVATVRLRVPAGSQVTFPGRPDSAARVDSAGPVARHDSSVGGFTYSTANYVLAAWDTGAQAIGLGDVTVATGRGTQTVPLNGLQVYVRSVLPRDTSLRKPKAFRPAMPVTAIDWRPLIAAAAALALLALLAYAWRRWRRYRDRALTPFQIAGREFARVDAERLIEAGEAERYAVEMVRVLRVYLAATVPAAVLSATTHQLADALRFDRMVPVHRLIGLLDETDGIKFARRRSTADEARAIGTESRAIVTDVHAALESEKTPATKAA